MYVITLLTVCCLLLSLIFFLFTGGTGEWVISDSYIYIIIIILDDG